MKKDVYRICKGYERKNIQTGDILDGIFMPDTFREFAVCNDLVTQRLYLRKHLGMCSGKLLT